MWPLARPRQREVWALGVLQGIAMHQARPIPKKMDPCMRKFLIDSGLTAFVLGCLARPMGIEKGADASTVEHGLHKLLEDHGEKRAAAIVSVLFMVLVLTISYGIGGPIVTVAMLPLTLNLVLTGVFILMVKKLINGVPVELV